MKILLLAVVLVATSFISTMAQAREMVALVSIGGGPQPGARQSNRSLGVDLDLWTTGFRHTARQRLSIGASYTYIASSRGPNHALHAVSLYPQLTLTPTDNSVFVRHLPTGASPYFFARALGPTWLSSNALGKRQQDNHFGFQAMVGVGLEFQRQGKRNSHLTLAWKHFSNANLFNDNGGIDLPLVLSFGLQL